tara:strand:- start:801 stop:1199 length:399 start_codon:yes stop_codon:yes gene_type:complete
MKNIITNKNKKFITSYKLYYDEKCPLCLKTKSYIERWLKPINTNYISISSSNLNKQKKLKALNYMLLEDSIGNEYWGYNTYCKLLRNSTQWYSFALIALSKVMKFYIVENIGLKIYKLISENRKRCDESCEL